MSKPIIWAKKKNKEKKYYFDVFSKVTEFVDQIKQMRRLVLVLAFQIGYYFFYTLLQKEKIDLNLCAISKY